ncbi:MAG: glycosyltransferase family 2 protein [Chitinophagales bacterium]
MKGIARKIIRPFLYYLYYLPFKNRINVSRAGKPLKKGITAVVAMKNEEYTLPFCLQSLVGFADQIVIIDNGSEDASLQKARAFKKEFGNRAEVDILELPGALLGDCREAGLKATRYQWHLRWDADMVAHTDGKNNMRQLREKVLNNSTPRAIQLPRFNINGDLKHCDPNKIVDAGEPILVWFNKQVFYKEYGKFDAIKLPVYFKQLKEKKYYYFHCQGLKSDENLMHRFHYFRWREILNTYSKDKLPSYVFDLDTFKQRRNEYLFETTNPQSLKFRYQRQLVPRFRKFNPENYKLYYPEVLREEMDSGKARFEIIYKDGDPYIRKDYEDTEMLDFIPSKEDLNWSVDQFFKRLENDLPHKQ